jgi:hypothetical protein
MVLSIALSGCTGSDDVASNTDDDIMVSETLTVTSSAFEHNGAIPVKHSCEGEDVNPDLEISGIPTEAVSLLLIMDDPDAPMGTFTHWVVWNIQVDSQIAEDSVPGIEGENSAGQVSYIGPCPPSGTHRYFFRVFALDTELDLESGSDRDIVEDSMNGHVVAYGELMGTYSRT